MALLSMKVPQQGTFTVIPSPVIRLMATLSNHLQLRSKSLLTRSNLAVPAVVTGKSVPDLSQRRSSATLRLRTMTSGSGRRSLR